MAATKTINDPYVIFITFFILSHQQSQFWCLSADVNISRKVTVVVWDLYLEAHVPEPVVVFI